MLDEENKKLQIRYNKEKNQNGSSGKQASSASAKVGKEITASIMSFTSLCFKLFMLFWHEYLVCMI